jgi:regulatory protein YycI of two-component signal transduction system YycFG
MDWSKAKNIILIVLVITNIFLLGAIAVKNLEPEDADESISDYTLSILEENGITVECEVPEGIQKMHALTVSYGKYDTNIVKNAIDRAKALAVIERTEKGYAQAADSLVEKCGFMDDGTRRMSVKIDGDSAVVLYKNFYKDVPLEECYMTVTFTDGKITDFDRKWMEPVSEGESRTEIMSPYSALLAFMQAAEADRAAAAKNGADSLTDRAAAAKNGADSLTAGAAAAKNGADSLTAGAAAAKNGADSLTNGAAAAKPAAGEAAAAGSGDAEPAAAAGSTSSITVEDMYIAYWIEDYDVEGDVLYDTALPAWCIVYNGGQTKYISAVMN